MPKTIVRDNDSLDDAIKRFKRDVSRAGTLVEAKKRQHYSYELQIMIDDHHEDLFQQF